MAVEVGFLIGKKGLLEFLLGTPVASSLRNVDALLPVRSLSIDPLYLDKPVTGELESVVLELSAICAPSSGSPLNNAMS